ncbi:hypothetical protein I4U23_003511 [Adineta vaga]|nr:hypothetical protein I4U23_003511 [Adineta vaga]
MVGIKRSRSDGDYGYNKNKKQNFDTNNFILLPKNKSCFENLASEIIYEVFRYLDFSHIYQSFFHLNNRLNRLILNPNGFLQINVCSMSKSNFDLYHQHLIQPNRHRINYLRLSNPFTVDFVFSPPLLIHRFIQLETLILDHIDTKYLKNIFRHLMDLPQLQSLNLSFTDTLSYSPTLLFESIFQLSKLKSCQLSYQTKSDTLPFPFYLSKIYSTSIESLVINTCLSIDSLDAICCCLPKLRYLSIDYLVGSNSFMRTFSGSISLTHFKTLSVKLENLNYPTFIQLIKSVFSRIEILHLTTSDPNYLHVDQWALLISSCLVNLRIFDIYYNGVLRQTDFMYNSILRTFDRSFWNERGWYFTHESEEQVHFYRLPCYLTNPYRRKSYELYWEHLSSSASNQCFTSVKHVHLRSDNMLNRSEKYFPNATMLTIEHNLQPRNDSFSIALNEILPLKHLKKLIIKNYYFPFEKVLQLLKSTSNLQSLCLEHIDLNTMLLNDLIQITSITTLELHRQCTYDDFQLLMYIFPQLQSMKIGMNRKEIHPIIRYLFTKPNHLFSLCITQIPKVCLQEIKKLIRVDNLITHYLIKLFDHDLYLWW